MIMVDDPRVAVRALKRNPYQPVPLPKPLPQGRARFPSPPSSANAGVFSPPAHLAELARRVNSASVDQLLALVEADFPDANQVEGDDVFQRRRTERIVERAWAAQQLGERDVKSKRVVAALERLVRERSLHKDWSYHRLDSSEIAAVLRSPNPAVRGTALLECIDSPTPPRRQALQAAAPWALELPPRK